MKYTFGTSSDAAKRLEEMAKFFNPRAASWLRLFTVNQPGTAVDLGCGPGFTTEMLSRVTLAKATYGLDNSETFLNMARTRYARLTFLQHDITTCPFPIAADIMYARFVLSHLRDSVKTTNNWISQLVGNGMLFIDELEDIETDSELFKAYLSTSAGLVASQGSQLYVGRTLSVGKYNGKVVFNDVAVIPVENWQAAIWFLPNVLTIWRNNEVVTEALGYAEIERISEELKHEVDLHTNKSNITWRMRRIAVGRD